MTYQDGWKDAERGLDPREFTDEYLQGWDDAQEHLAEQDEQRRQWCNRHVGF